MKKNTLIQICKFFTHSSAAVLLSSIALAGNIPYSANSTIVVSPSQLLADGNAATTITVTFKDADGVGIPNINTIRYKLLVSGSSNTIINLSGITDRKGRVITTLKSTVPELKNISIIYTGNQPNPNWTQLSSSVNFTQAPHPRLLVNPDKIQKIKNLISAKSNPVLLSYISQITTRANVYVGQSPPIQYGTNPGDLMAPVLGSTV